VGRFGKRPDFEDLLDPHDRFKQHETEFFDSLFADFDRQAGADDG